MNLRRPIKHLLHTAMLLMVAMVVGHIHSHRCLDGQEPALSVHFEAFSGHPDHDGDDHHDDVENELVPQGLPGKAPDHDAPLFLLSLSLLFTFRPLPRQLQLQHRDDTYHPPPRQLLPPARAPPSRSS
jgi:hypothetical protein